ncbi:adenosylcobinamide-phosphate synthase CbiB [Desulfolutivibrio sp.]|uniref:adenosylcobinamide-phosphate synthase CbiB n=1 Tax=Desulfolutivibrio sp. TaxID=2773296 RepID=UPI002F96D449
MNPALFVVAAILDRILGDPPGWPHPVRLIGAGLRRLERAAPVSPFPRRLYGVAVTLALALACALVVDLCVSLPGAGGLFAVYFAFAGLALGSLLREARAVLHLLEAGDLPGARRALAGLVSRDTARMDALAVRRALAETVSENFNDGFVAPLFYLVLGGPALLWAYKAVSTMDSMWGYRTPHYRELGWFCARADDALAFVPARLSALALVGGGWAMRRRPVGVWSRIRRDAGTMASPNAGWPMAAAAWVCGAGMGGAAVYFGQAVDKPRLGPDGQWDGPHLRLLVRVVSRAGTGLAVAGMLMFFLI